MPCGVAGGHGGWDGRLRGIAHAALRPASQHQVLLAVQQLAYGVKLILHALHENNVPFINDSEAVRVVEISTGISLGVILGVLMVTVIASLLSPAGKAQTAITNARRHATSYLDSEYTADPAERERIFGLLLKERDRIVALGPKYKQKVRDEAEPMALLERARDSHDAAVDRGEGAPTGPPKIIPPRP